jgi:hypothetical protein
MQPTNLHRLQQANKEMEFCTNLAIIIELWNFPQARIWQKASSYPEGGPCVRKIRKIRSQNFTAYSYFYIQPVQRPI